MGSDQISFSMVNIPIIIRANHKLEENCESVSRETSLETLEAARMRSCVVQALKSFRYL